MRSIWIYLLMVSILLAGCGDSNLRFSESQPSKVKTITKFPADLQSDLVILSDSTFIGYFDLEYPLRLDSGMNLNVKNYIEITSNAIFNHLNGSITFDFKALEDSTTKLQLNQQFILDSLIMEYYQRPKYKYDLISSEDSVRVFNFSIVDTMFYSSPINIIKKYKNDFYINIQIANNTWSVYKIHERSKSNNLRFCSISENDETVLRRIMKINDENFENEIITPTPKSMKQFFKMGGFENYIELKKVLTDAKNP